MLLLPDLQGSLSQLLQQLPLCFGAWTCLRPTCTLPGLPLCFEKDEFVLTGGTPAVMQIPQQAQQQQGADADDNIKVVVRVRPLFPAELAKGATNVISVAEDSSSLQVSQSFCCVLLMIALAVGLLSRQEGV